MSGILDLNTLENGRPGALGRMTAAFQEAGLGFEQIGLHHELHRPRVTGNVPDLAEYLEKYSGPAEWVEGVLSLQKTILADRYGLPYVTGRDLWLSGSGVNQPVIEDLVIPPLPDPARLHHVDRAVVIGGRGAAIYGHWLLDFVPQILTTRALERRLGVDLPILMVNYTPFGRRLLRFLGLEDRCIFVRRDTPVEIEEMWLPLITKWSWGYSTEMLQRSFAFLMKAAMADGKLPPRERLPRILVARKKPPFCSNFEALRAALEPRGFTVVHPEKLPYRKQFQMFLHAETVVGEDGSAMHNTGFCRPGSKVVVYSRARADSKINWWHDAVAQASDLSLTYLQSRVTGADSYEAPVDDILDRI